MISEKRYQVRPQEEQHAFLGASKYNWVNYDEDRIIQNYISSFAQPLGTCLHEFAAKRISMGRRLRKQDVDSPIFYLLDHGIPDFAFDMTGLYPNLMKYVNDAIGFRMEPEKRLEFSVNCFGTADSLSFSDGALRIHDLKTGTTPAHMEQLEIYTALFCLCSNVDPSAINMELRIYQADDIYVHIPEADVIYGIMDKIVTFDRAIERVKEGHIS